MKILLTFIGAIVLALGGYFYHQTPSPTLGDYNPTGAGTYRLQSSVTGTQTTVTLTSFKEPISGIPYTMSYLNSSIEYGTIEPQTTNSKEFISFSGITQNSDGTATLTGVIRGLSFSYPFTASTTFQQSHSGQSIFILSNPPQLYKNFYNLSNAATSTNTLVFSSTTPPYYDSPAAQANGTYIATTSEFASVAYVNKIAIAGAANATLTVKGILQMATGLQAASSTALGSTGASLALTSGIATDTPAFGNATSSSLVVVSDLTGHIKQSWLDLTAAWSFAASSVAKLTLNTVAYVFPSSQGAANTFLQNDGSGNLSWVSGYVQLISTTTQQTMNFATTTSFTGMNKLRITVLEPSLANTGSCLRFNTDSATNYGSSVSTNVSARTGQSLKTSIDMEPVNGTGTTTDAYFIIDVNNDLSKRKIMSFTGTETDANSDAPYIISGGAVWNNTSAQITSVVIANNDAACGTTVPVGTIIRVYGYN